VTIYQRPKSAAWAHNVFAHAARETSFVTLVPVTSVDQVAANLRSLRLLRRLLLNFQTP
jgi:hypothetical protein